MQFHHSIRNFRTSRGLSQENIAEYLGIDYTSYGRKENGKARFSLDEAVKLAEYYKVGVDELINHDSHAVVADEQAHYQRSTPSLSIEIKLSPAEADRLGVKELILKQMGL